MGYNSQGTTYSKPNFTYMKDKKIMIYSYESTEDKIGNQTMQWTLISFSNLWASYRSISGHEKLNAVAKGHEETCYFTVNWRNDIKAGMRVVYNDKVYEITYVDDFEGYKKDLKLSCMLVQNADLKDYQKFRSNN